MLIGCTGRPDEYRELSETGFDYTEFPCRVICQMNDDDFLSLRNQVDEISFPVLGMNIYCPPEVVIAGPGFDEDIVAVYARKAAGRAGALGVRFIGIGSPKSRILPEDYDLISARKELMTFLKITSEEFGNFGIKTTLEALAPCFCNFVNTLPEAYEIVKEFDDENIGLVADFYNMEHSGEADIDLSKYIDKVFHMHISDDDGAPTKRSYLKPEKLSIHASRISRLQQSPYNGMITIEVDVPFDKMRAENNLSFLKSLV